MGFWTYQLLCFVVLGAIVGSFLNVCICRLPWQKSILWPGSHCPRCLRPVRGYDNVPILSYLVLRGRCRDCGARFSPRYIIIEAFTAALFGFLFWIEWARAGRVDLLRYGYQLLLVAALIVATFIDLDFQIIPDSVTVPGMLAGLAGGAILIGVHPLPISHPAAEPGIGPLSLAGLLVAIGWLLWLAALAAQHPAVYGPVGAAQVVLLGASLVYLVLQTALLIAGPIENPWPGWPAWLAAHPHWNGCATSLVGLLVGAGLVWLVRVLGTAALSKEAMGFGDVTLMALMGAYLGWQPTVLVFFLAPFCALLVGLVQWLVYGENVLPYGPYLSLAALAVMLLWQPLWPLVAGHFEIITAIPAGVAILLLLPVLAAALLKNWRLREREEGPPNHAGNRV